jgi:hypothetical protein
MRWIGRDASEFLELFLAECPRWDHRPMSQHRSLSLPARSLRVAATILGLALIVAGFVPASANAASHVWIRNMVGDNFCLDSNSAGTVYVNPCQRGNRYQKWEHWNGGWARNVKTGRCLENPAFSFSAIRTRPCRQIGAQYWKNWRYGWFQRPAYASVSKGCLTVDGRRVWVSPCGDPFNPIEPVQWFTELA